MPGPTYDDRPATSGSPRLAALALLIAGGAAVGLAVHPGSALASSSDRTLTAAGPQAGTLALRAIADTVDDPSPGDDAVYGGFDDNAPDDDGLPSDGTDDDGGPAAGDTVDGADDGSATDDGTTDDRDDEAADAAGTSGNGKGGKRGKRAKNGASRSSRSSATLVVDRRGRALEGPKSFAASRTARAGGLHWAGWSTSTAVARGRITVSHGKARSSQGAGTVTLTRLSACANGRSVYRKATLVIGGKTVATVALPGCSKVR